MSTSDNNSADGPQQTISDTKDDKSQTREEINSIIDNKGNGKPIVIPRKSKKDRKGPVSRMLIRCHIDKMTDFSLWIILYHQEFWKKLVLLFHVDLQMLS